VVTRDEMSRTTHRSIERLFFSLFPLHPSASFFFVRLPLDQPLFFFSCGVEVSTNAVLMYVVELDREALFLPLFEI